MNQFEIFSADINRANIIRKEKAAWSLRNEKVLHPVVVAEQRKLRYMSKEGILVQDGRARAREAYLKSVERQYASEVRS